MPDVLVVDRDLMSARAMISHLKTRSVAVVETVAQAVDVVEGGKVVILAVYADAPDISNMIASLYRAKPNVRIVAVGNQSSLDLERAVRLSKVFFYTIRPIDFEELNAVLQRALGEGKVVGS